jgi:hypothetical protein
MQWLSEEDIHIDTWNKIMAVAMTPELYEPEIQEKLPANLSTMSLLAKLTKEQLDQAVQEGIVTPELSYRALAAWKKPRQKAKDHKVKVLRLIPDAIAIAPWASNEQIAEVKEALQQALSKLSIEARLISIPEIEKLEEKAEMHWQEQEFKVIFKQFAPPWLAMEMLEQPLRELSDKEKCKTHDEMITVGLLKHTHQALKGKNKQARYKSREIIMGFASSQNVIALAIARRVFGREMEIIGEDLFSKEYGYLTNDFD